MKNLTQELVEDQVKSHLLQFSRQLENLNKLVQGIAQTQRTNTTAATKYRPHFTTIGSTFVHNVEKSRQKLRERR